jgi:hypothetical protein
VLNELPPRTRLPPYVGGIQFGVIPSPRKFVSKPAVIPTGPPPFPPPPSAVDWIGAISDWGILKNDVYNDCVIACMGHVIESWTGAAATRVVVTDADVFSAYCAVSGYNPTSPAPGPGMTVGNAMSYWQGNGLAGHRIDASCASNAIGAPAVYEPIITALVEFYGAAILAVRLPAGAVAAFQQGDPWDTNIAGPSVENHCVPVLAYDQNWCEVITWGRVQKVSWAFIRQYTIEIWGVMSGDWIRANVSSPTNQSRAHLDQSLSSTVTVSLA